MFDEQCIMHLDWPQSVEEMRIGVLDSLDVNVEENDGSALAVTGYPSSAFC